MNSRWFGAAALLVMAGCSVRPPVFSSPSPASALVLRGVVLEPDAGPVSSPGASRETGGTDTAASSGGDSQDDCTPEPSGKPSLEAFLGPTGMCDDGVAEAASSAAEEPADAGARVARPGEVGTAEEGGPAYPAAQKGGAEGSTIRDGLVFVQTGGTTRYADVYGLVDTLMEGACPPRVDIRCEPITEARREGAVWASAEDPVIHVRAVDPRACSLDGLEPQLLSNLFKVCLGRLTERDGEAWSRHEKGLRFLEEGFAEYLLTRDEVSALGERPEARRDFMEFVAQQELRAGFSLDDFWERLPTVDELADPSYVPHPRRFEAQYVAGAFVRHLVENEGLGVAGYLAMWRRLAALPLAPGPDGNRIPRPEVVPVLNRVLRDCLGDESFDLTAAWNRFREGVSRVEYHRPRVTMTRTAGKVVLTFSRPMRTGTADLMINGMQFGIERFDGRLAAWANPRTVVLDLSAAREQFGIDRVETIRVNGGRCWQWMLSEDGIPAEDTTFALSPED